MKIDPNERRVCLERSEGEASPSTGWREVYAAMGISPDGDVEDRELAGRRDRLAEADTRSSGTDWGRVEPQRSPRQHGV